MSRFEKWERIAEGREFIDGDVSASTARFMADHIRACYAELDKLRKVVDAAREVKEHGWRHAFGETGALLNTPRLRLEQALADLDKGEV